MAFSTETNYIKLYDIRPNVTHLSIQGINIIALKEAVFENGRYDAENGGQCQRVIHHFFRKTKQIKFLTKI